MRARILRTGTLVLMVASLLGFAAVATATLRSVFAEQTLEASDLAESNSIVPSEPDIGAGIAEPPLQSPSLAAAQAQGLRVDQYPWFSDGVETPPDALLGAAELLDAVETVPVLSVLKPISGIATVFPDEEDVGWRSVVLKIDDNHLVVIIKQRYVEGMVIPLDGEPLSYRGGEAMIGGKPGQRRVLLVKDGEMVIVRLQAVVPPIAEGIRIDHDELLDIADQLIAAHDH